MADVVRTIIGFIIIMLPIKFGLIRWIACLTEQEIICYCVYLTNLGVTGSVGIGPNFFIASLKFSCRKSTGITLIPPFHVISARKNRLVPPKSVSSRNGESGGSVK